MMALSLLRAVGAVTALSALFTGCDRPAGAAGHAAQPYEIVTQTRPESIDGYMKVWRLAHQACAFARESMHLPPAPPLVQVPPGFVTDRITYLSTGGAYLTRHEAFQIDATELTPELGCKSRLGSTMTEELVQGGKVQSARREIDGVVEADPVAPLPPPKGTGDSGYSEHKKMGGVAMRCAPSPATLGPGVMQDLCVPDVTSGTPLDGRGDPVVVHARATLLGRGDVVLLTEPVIIQTGKPVSQARLALSKAQ